MLPLAVPQYYTYIIPDDLDSQVKIGSRVSVLFGKRKLYTGIIRHLHNSPPQGYELHPILSVMDPIPLVGENLLQFWEWMAGYYMCSTGEVFRAAVPAGLKLESETQIFAVENGSETKLSDTEYSILSIAENSPGISIHKVASFLGRKDIMPVIKALLDKKMISLKENLIETYKPKVRDIIVLPEEYSTPEKIKELLDSTEKTAKKQAGTLMAFLHLCDYQDQKGTYKIVKDKLVSAPNVSLSSLKTLISKGILLSEKEEISRLAATNIQHIKPNALNATQTIAYMKILDEFESKQVVLLHGITSSGKTEIYIHLIEHVLRENKQVLYLLPEIALTTQIISRLQGVFGNRVGIYHSKFSDAERAEVYENLRGTRKTGSPEYDIILGVRSSVFLPFKNLGLVIVDEEHENTYKQFDPAPRYNARDSVIMLASIFGARVLLGTATPSFESYLNAINKRYGLVEIKERYLDVKLPEIILTDMREARKQKKVYTHFSYTLVDEIAKALEKKEQVILFQNRRGFSPYLECNACGWIPYCRNCDVTLTYHKKSNSLNCHYCGYSITYPQSCNSCGAHDIVTRGFGTEKVEDEISILFPSAKVARMDLDTTRSRKSYEKIISSFEAGKTDILVGTQMISKGLDFERVSVVGILNADNLLNFPDFRSFERSYQLMMQVSGRAGRRNEQGRVIIQTSNPQHIVLKHVKTENYTEFFNHQAGERRMFGYPPFCRLIKLTLRHKKPEIVADASLKLAIELRKKLGVRVIGPEAPLVSRVFTYHQKCIIIKLEKDKHFSERRDFVALSIRNMTTGNEYKSLQIIPDMDPYN